MEIKKLKYSPPDISRFYDFNPVIVDDIISSAATMIETIKLIKFARPVCIAVHAIFAQNSYQELLKLPIDRVISCNTIPHPSNCIDLSGLIAKHLQFF